MNPKENGLAVIFDFNRTIYDPDRNDFIDGAEDLLRFLHEKQVPMYLVSKAEESRPQVLEEMGLANYFQKTFFVERKEPALFFEILRDTNLQPKDVYVIGDHLHKEIRSGNQSGMRTIWLKSGKFADLEPATVSDTPWQTITHLREVLPLIGVTL
ncbi:hypothetical protein C4568_01390 [Candidatus Parcubacteria bacterium]|nr:MAG: hypothetical protein C4568_01390 [Candidatus Parcubacteria bacterium]